MKKAYQYFWGVTILVIFLGTLTALSADLQGTLSFNSKDTYYVMAYTDIASTFAVFYFVLGLGYWLSKPLKLALNKTLTIIHTIITVGAFPAAWLVVYVDYHLNTPFDPFNTFEIKDTGILVLAALVALVQPLFLLNIVMGMVKKK